MLLDDETGRARGERVLVAAEIRRGAGLRDAAGDFQRRGRRAVHAPDGKHIPFAIGHGDDRVGRNHDGARDGLVDDRLHVHGRELRLCDNRPEQQTGE
jgi:hypothetical protein